VTDEVPIHLERADEFLRDARLLFESRSYYAVFHGAKAVLFRLGIERKSHHAVWGAFGEMVVNPGLMEKRYHKGAVDLFLSRVESDYSPRTKDTPETTQGFLIFATEFVAACRGFLQGRD